ncbi:hypothetical protein BJV74DRAFT_852944 [Russula compacta]|nr:hypothetical protein BJV74DRAFT_852944 [Russula compacta]
MRSNNGFICATVHDPSSPDGNSCERPPLDVQLHADYGDIYVSLPRCFRGPINIRTGDSRIALSPALEECMALLSDVRGTRVYFVGNRPHSGKWGGGDKDGKSKAPEEPLDELFCQWEVYERADRLGRRRGAASDGTRWLVVLLQWHGQIFHDRPSMLTSMLITS